MKSKTGKNGKSIFARIISIMHNIILIPMIIVMIVICFFLLASQTNNSLPTICDNLIVKIVSGSMEPSFRKGEIVTVKRINADELQVDDVIAFYRYTESRIPSVIWFHRIIDINKDKDGYLRFQTKGDANMLPDANWTREDYIVGIYNRDARTLHKIISFAVSRMGIFCLIIVPSGLIFLCESLRIMEAVYDSRKKEKKKGILRLEPIAPPNESLTEYHENTASEFKTNNSFTKTITIKNTFGKQNNLNEILANIDELKQKKRLTAKMILNEALKLEKIKNKQQYKYDFVKQKKISDALDWCYAEISNIQAKKSKTKI